MPTNYGSFRYTFLILTGAKPGEDLWDYTIDTLNDWTIERTPTGWVCTHPLEDSPRVLLEGEVMTFGVGPL